MSDKTKKSSTILVFKSKVKSLTIHSWPCWLYKECLMKFHLNANPFLVLFCCWFFVSLSFVFVLNTFPYITLMVIAISLLNFSQVVGTIHKQKYHKSVSNKYKILTQHIISLNIIIIIYSFSRFTV